MQIQLTFVITSNLCTCVRVFSGLTWAIAQAMVDTLKPIVEQCVLNQTRGYWLLFYVLNVAITICMKVRVDYNCQAV